MELLNLCRSCMKEVASRENENFSKTVVEMFYFCTNIKIAEEDNKLPKQFCFDCVKKIEASYVFITEAHKVDVTIKNIISRTETSVIVQPESVRNTTAITNATTTVTKLTLPDYKLCSRISHNINQEMPVQDLNHNIGNDSQFENESSFDIEDTEKETEKYTDNKAKLDNEDKKNACLVCRKVFSSKVWFAKHMEKEHTGHKSFKCSTCQKTFSRRAQLVSHAVCHSSERRHACASCGKRFKRRKQLAAHAQAHSDVRPYVCHYCQMGFKLRSVLRSHLRLHEEDKPHLCSYCGWSFAQAGNLSVHMRKHTGEKPFFCTECEFRASTASSLKRHQRRHREARLYVCTHCRKGFYDASGLARHTRTHTGELPYKCGECSRAFADSWKRKTHLMRAHKYSLHDIPRMSRDGHVLT